jgi:nitrate reductase gamma subunit
MIDAFLFVGLPYIALVVFVVGCIYRLTSKGFSVSSLSSQFLENRKLLWGSAPWHIGIVVILLGHFVGGFFPKVWSSLMTLPYVLWVAESVGVAMSILCLGGLSVLIFRRLTSSRVQAVTSTMDLVVVALLLVQVTLGLLTALLFPFGAAWSTGTVVPYFWSLLTLQPDMTFVSDFPALFRLHIVGAWILILILPFTRLIHLLVVPLQYLFRAPQIVIWGNPRRIQHAVQAQQRAESRREFIQGAVGLTVAGALLSLGAFDKLFNFFKGAPDDKAVKADILEKKLRRLQQTAEERELELDRQRNQYILVCPYNQLSETKGNYFIDFQMSPALAFKGKDALPSLISAKCTHLGCTVGSEIDSNGCILCPCHVSYFNIATGIPNEGAPAKSPLKHLSWALMDPAGKIVVTHAENKAQEVLDPAILAQCSVYIVKPEDA